MKLFGTKKSQEYDDPEEDKEEEQEDEDQETYLMDFTCQNCGNECNFEIPIKTTVLNFFKNKRCEECGCNVIQPNEVKIMEEW